MSVTVRQGPGEWMAVGQLRIRFLVDDAGTGSAVTMVEVEVPAGVRMPAPNSHEAIETIYGLSGVSTWKVEAETVELSPGEVAFIPGGALHGFSNESAAAARFLAISVPGIFGPAYLRDLAAVLAEAGDGTPDRAEVERVMRRHGLTTAPAATTDSGPRG
jgi:quercetin dioxygenase-like cupin family protein